MITDSHRMVDRSCVAGHAHGPEHAELAGPLQDRQGQRVADAEQGDDDRQGQQGVDQPEHLVDDRPSGPP